MSNECAHGVDAVIQVPVSLGRQPELRPCARGCLSFEDLYATTIASTSCQLLRASGRTVYSLTVHCVNSSLTRNKHLSPQTNSWILRLFGIPPPFFRHAYYFSIGYFISNERVFHGVVISDININFLNYGDNIALSYYGSERKPTKNWVLLELAKPTGWFWSDKNNRAIFALRQWNLYKSNLWLSRAWSVLAPYRKLKPKGLPYKNI